MKKNIWVVNHDLEFASWDAVFPKGKMLDSWELWPFLKGVLEIGEQEAVYRVAQVGVIRNLPRPAERQSYAQLVEQYLTEKGKLLFFNQLDLGNHVSTPARLAYYEENGVLVEDEVSDLGGLIRRLRPEKVDERDEYMTSDNPVTFSGQIGIRYSNGDLEGACLNIYLHTDIWFPKVMGYLEDWGKGEWGLSIDGTNRLWQDNRELALRHTPRLNRFLARVKQLTLEYGGTWGIDKSQDTVVRYHSQWDENGIFLDTED
jgi:hypothetical protein